MAKAKFDRLDWLAFLLPLVEEKIFIVRRASAENDE